MEYWRTTIAPARMNSDIMQNAEKIAHTVMENLGGAGVFGIEMFENLGGAGVFGMNY